MVTYVCLICIQIVHDDLNKICETKQINDNFKKIKKILFEINLNSNYYLLKAKYSRPKIFEIAGDEERSKYISEFVRHCLETINVCDSNFIKEIGQSDRRMGIQLDSRSPNKIPNKISWYAAASVINFSQLKVLLKSIAMPFSPSNSSHSIQVNI